MELLKQVDALQVDYQLGLKEAGPVGMKIQEMYVTANRLSERIKELEGDNAHQQNVIALAEKIIEEKKVIRRPKKIPAKLAGISKTWHGMCREVLLTMNTNQQYTSCGAILSTVTS